MFVAPDKKKGLDYNPESTSYLVVVSERDKDNNILGPLYIFSLSEFLIVKAVVAE